MQETVDITGLNKADLLCGLWHRTVTLGMGHLEGRDKLPPTKDEARAHLALTDGYVDYFLGKPIKVDLSPDSNRIETWDYDRAAGAGACVKVVESVRAGKALLDIAASERPIATTTASAPFTVRTFATGSNAMQHLISELQQQQHEQK